MIYNRGTCCPFLMLRPVDCLDFQHETRGKRCVVFSVTILEPQQTKTNKKNKKNRVVPKHLLLVMILPFIFGSFSFFLLTTKQTYNTRLEMLGADQHTMKGFSFLLLDRL